ncbi:L-glutamate gamma-semialdehyde dehydrogenase [Propioniciclava coleopterorum]|uniref:L-glutamate gamma-semialdehyde dehydrogenase n=1 Tax=Propioniciclava coleopterorum TaxID=2714937 RepID=A0A6G7Y7M7_9ACTN|nr:L-glutamate gamma-semialdehyde dehydrogenase [Propioniciclava coleopterorum]QIK72617.1 L-glutamate gamma-semialdehyde dehydrogenase [Propioniciclava coleopterorum]
MDGVTRVPLPVNEPVLGYAPGSPERAALEASLDALATREPALLPAWIGGRFVPGSGERIDVTMPSDHGHVLGWIRAAGAEDARAAVDAALAAGPAWADLPFDERAAVFLRAADLIAGPYRAEINAATMLGQGKTAQQAEIDSACELVDFLRFNVAYAQRIMAEQPESAPGVWNRMEYRPLEGFVYAITPFNFTAIAGNLPTSAALLGNPVVWKPAVTQTLAASVFARVLAQAGLPGGVINMLPGHGREISDVLLGHRDLAGIHFTGSTPVFQSLWRQVADNIAGYRSYPRLVGETGGKDFVVAHPTADRAALVTALVRGAFEYSGQKCSAASRAYIARSVWDDIRDDLVARTDALAVGDVRDLTNFTSAVIDERSFRKLAAVIDACHADPGMDVVAGGTYDDSVGWFVRPTVVVGTDPASDLFTTEFFGPILGVHVYEDADFEAVLDLVDEASPYALTGAVFATDRAAVLEASRRLRFTAGNFYVNDKPTGAVVGQQPFGGARASGTNDKAGSLWNLIRWASPRAIKEALVPPTSTGYPHMEA